MPLTEPEFNAKVVGLMNQIIREKNLGFEEARMGTSLKMADETTKFPDGVIWKNKTTQNASLLFEIKRPHWDASNIDLINDASLKAFRLGAKYFATWNMRDFILWETFRPRVALYDRVKEWYKNIIWVKDISEVDRKENWDKIKIFLGEFLTALDQDIFKRKRVFVGLPLDQFFIRKLDANVDINTRVFTIALKQKCIEDKNYYRQLCRWIWDQGWHPKLKTKAQETDHLLYERFARVAAYIFANKVLFYNVLRTEHKKLRPIQTQRIKRSQDLNQILKTHFKAVLRINYDTIYKIDIFDDLKVPDNCLEQMVKFLEDFDKYDFKEVNYEILGQVYEDLIPEREKHEMGQYFTPPSTVDLINSFCIQNPNDVILDLGCGAGTFLVRAYARLKYLKKRKKTHKELLEQLWGVDKASFPAHLAQINLVLPDLSERENFPYIANKDAFDITPQKSYFEVPFHRGIKHEYKKTSSKFVKVRVPEMDAVVGNPPYIRQEKIGEQDKGKEKDYIIEVVEKDWGKFKLTNQTGISIGRQADIYVYFFIHGAKFLKEGGRLGFVTSNSWLDVRYGAGLQKFFLDNFKIIAIIESKVERSFAKADINTAITIIEHCSDKRKRENNTVKFVILKEKMDKLIPKDGDKDRFIACEKLIAKIRRTKSIYEDSQMRVLPKKQRELYEEGIEDHTYVGSKWGGKYLRAPDIFFKILEKGKDLFVPLKDVAEVRRGFTTGANEFFYLTEEQINAHIIETEFLKPAIKSPRESRNIIIKQEDLKYKVLFVHADKKELKGTNVIKYIYWGEEKKHHKKPTCAARRRWYDSTPGVNSPIAFPERFRERFFVNLNPNKVYLNKSFYGVGDNLTDPDILLVCAMLNSTITMLFAEIQGRLPGGGGGPLDMDVWMAESINVLNPSKITPRYRHVIISKFEKLLEREVCPVFQELKSKDRRQLDDVVFDILHLTKEERQQVYDAVEEMVRCRLEKAKTFQRTNKNKKEEFDPPTYADHILSEVFISQQKKEFPNDFMNPSWETISIALPKIEPKGKLTVEEFFGKASLRIDGETVDCGTTPKANFVELTIEKGIRDKVIVPADDKNCIKAVRDYLNYRKIIETQIEDTMKMFNLTKKQTKAVLSEIEDRY